MRFTNSRTEFSNSSVYAGGRGWNRHRDRAPLNAEDNRRIELVKGFRISGLIMSYQRLRESRLKRCLTDVDEQTYQL